MDVLDRYNDINARESGFDKEDNDQEVILEASGTLLGQILTESGWKAFVVDEQQDQKER